MIGLVTLVSDKIQLRHFFIEAFIVFKFHLTEWNVQHVLVSLCSQIKITYLCIKHFHVSIRQLLRKRHIGNDIVTIVFQEPGAHPFTPKAIRSHFQHVFIIVRVHNPCSDSTCYRWVVAFAYKMSEQR